MPKYNVQFAPAAARQLRKLTPDVQSRIASVIDKLSNNPLPSGVRKLSGPEGFYRVRVGDYRIVYQFFSGKLLILVVRVGHRKDIYDY
ncbi:MAG: plasmid stabilization protein [Proteobacteria bacterium]|nr:MAG: plasmid stabilization protein [Pseudomonadota bacterium]